MKTTNPAGKREWWTGTRWLAKYRPALFEEQTAGDSEFGMRCHGNLRRALCDESLEAIDCWNDRLCVRGADGYAGWVDMDQLTITAKEITTNKR